MTKTRYYIRVSSEDNNSFQDYLERNGIEGTFLSIDMGSGGGSIMYTAVLNPEEASTMRLSFSLVGFLNLNRALNRQVERRAAKIIVTNSEQT